MPGQLEGNAGGLRDLGMVRRVRQQNARAVAIQADVMQHGRKPSVLRRAPLRNANDLQTLHFHLLIAEHTDSGRRNGIQIFAVVPKLLMISCDEIYAVWRHEFAQWLRRSPCVDGRPIIQIASNKNRVWLFPQNLCNQAPQKTAVSDVPQVHIADQRRSSPVPGGRQVRKPNRRSRDTRPTCVEDTVQSGHYCGTEQQFHGPMEVHVQPRQPRNSENNPGGNRRKEEEAHQTHPNRSSPVKRTQRGICIAKGQQRSGNKAYRQKTEGQFDPERPGRLAP
jgi:hypothetical protein